MQVPLPIPDSWTLNAPRSPKGRYTCKLHLLSPTACAHKRTANTHMISERRVTVRSPMAAADGCRDIWKEPEFVFRERPSDLKQHLLLNLRGDGEIGRSEESSKSTAGHFSLNIPLAYKALTLI